MNDRWDDELPPLTDTKLTGKERMLHLFLLTLCCVYGLLLVYAGIRWVLLPLGRWLLQHL